MIYIGYLIPVLVITILLLHHLYQHEVMQIVYPKYEYNNHSQKLDTRGQLNDTLDLMIEKYSPNLPFIFWMKHNARYLNAKNAKCAAFPDIYSIKWSGDRWQIFTASAHHSIYLLSAYIDDRIKNRTFVRFMTLSLDNEVKHATGLFAQLWYVSKPGPITVKLQSSSVVKPEMLSFPVPSGEFPSAVSIVKSPCEKADNLMKVIPPPSDRNKSDFGVCVHAAEYQDDVSDEIIEWMEILKILGVSKVYLYIYHVHPNIKKTLEFYESTGLVELTQLSLPAHAPNQQGLLKNWLYDLPRRRKKYITEIATYNDCFFKHMYKHRYISILDMDEFIIPGKQKTWKAMIEDIEDQEDQGYCFISAFFVRTQDNKNAPQSMKMLQSFNRTEYGITKSCCDKCLHNTDIVKYVTHHRAAECLYKECKEKKLQPIHIGSVQHYHQQCVHCRFESNKLLAFQDDLVRNFNTVVSKLWKSDSKN